jgi:hypothetical protein
MAQFWNAVLANCTITSRRPPFLIVLILDRLVCCDWGEPVKLPPPPPPPNPPPKNHDRLWRDGWGHKRTRWLVLFTQDDKPSLPKHTGYTEFTYCFSTLLSKVFSNLQICPNPPPSPWTGAHVYGLHSEISRETREVLLVLTGFCLAWLIESPMNVDYINDMLFKLRTIRL